MKTHDISSNSKSSYEEGLMLFKDSLKEIGASTYKSIIDYFEYPLSLIEKSVEEARKNSIDTDDFYKSKSVEVLDLYDRLIKTLLVCKSQTGTRKEKKKVKEVLNAIKK